MSLKSISFKKLLNSSVLVEYNEEYDAFIIGGNSGGNGAGGNNKNYIYNSSLINFNDGIPQYFSIFGTSDSSNKTLTEANFGSTIKITNLIFKINDNSISNGGVITIYKYIGETETSIGTFNAAELGTKTFNLNETYNSNDKIVFSIKVSGGTGYGMLSGIIFEIE